MYSSHNRNQTPRSHTERNATSPSDRTVDEILPGWDEARPAEIVFIRDAYEPESRQADSPEYNFQLGYEEDPLLEYWEMCLEFLLPEHLEAATEIFSREPNAFLAYFDRYYLEESPDDLAQDFDSIYVGSYNTPEEWAEESFEALGWEEAVRDTQNTAAIPEGILRLDTDAFLDWAQNSMGFEFLAGGDQVHIFQP